MNLKAAARRLGVHYQTAYRLVRSGELIAVRIGSSYEISEAAVQRYLASRHLLDDASNAEPVLPTTEIRRTNGHDPARITVELQSLMDATTLSTRPILDLITRHLSETIGDTCMLRQFSPNREWLVSTSYYHHDPARLGMLAAMAEGYQQPVGEAMEQQTIHEAKVHRIDFLRIDAARHLIPPAFQQYAARMMVYSLLSVPVLDDVGQVIALLTLARDLPGQPYTAHDEAVAKEMAGWVSAALERVSRFTAGWTARQELHDRAEALLAHQPWATDDDLLDTLVDMLGDTTPAALFGLDRRLIACNEPFAHRVGLDVDAPPDEPFVSHIATACVLGEGDDVWQRLVSGEADYLDQLSAGCDEGCPISDGIHWAVAHRPDATPAFVIATCSADERHRLPNSPESARCWAICQVLPTHRVDHQR